MASVQPYHVRVTITCRDCEMPQLAGEFTESSDLETSKKALQAQAQKHADKTGHQLGMISQTHARIVPAPKRKELTSGN